MMEVMFRLGRKYALLWEASMAVGIAAAMLFTARG
jgi:hypothetical protein